MPPAPSTQVRQSIAQSWERAAQGGLMRADPIRPVIIDAEFDTGLVRAASPVIDDLAEQLGTTDCALLLADRQQRIVIRRFNDCRIGQALDAVAAVPGSAYTEQTSGTNAISTVFETGLGGYVLGQEHYLEQLAQFRCYGHPIRHPITGVMEGVLDITSQAAGAEPLMRALIVTAVRAIEGRLLLSSPTSHMRLLGAYQARAARTNNAILAFGRDITLANDEATRLMDDTMIQTLRAVCAAADLGPGQSVLVAAFGPLPGRSIRITAVDGAPDSCLVELVESSRTTAVPRRLRLAPAPQPSRPDAVNLLVCGEPGSGRSSYAHKAAASSQVVRVHPGSSAAQARADLERADASATVLLDDLDRFGPDLLDVIDDLVDPNADTSTRVIATAVDAATLPPSLVGRFGEPVTIDPLRRRIEELPSLARAMLRNAAGPGSAMPRLSTAAIGQLSRYSWPGNLTELRAVLSEAALRARRRGIRQLDIDVAHLPQRIARAPRRRLTPLEEAEYRMISDALARHGGNKSHVADELGIGRSTLYRRLRAFGLSG